MPEMRSNRNAVRNVLLMGLGMAIMLGIIFPAFVWAMSLSLPSLFKGVFGTAVGSAVFIFFAFALFNQIDDERGEVRTHFPLPSLAFGVTFLAVIVGFVFGIANGIIFSWVHAAFVASVCGAALLAGIGVGWAMSKLLAFVR